MNVEIRRADLIDAPAVAGLFDAYRQFYKQASDLSLALTFIEERLRRNESVIFIAEDQQNHAIGFIQLYPSFSSVSARRTWIVNDLFVLPAQRGRSVGFSLLDAAKTHAVETGAKRISLSTAHDNPAQKLYEAVGYVRNTAFYQYELMLD